TPMPSPGMTASFMDTLSSRRTDSGRIRRWPRPSSTIAATGWEWGGSGQVDLRDAGVELLHDLRDLGVADHPVDAQDDGGALALDVLAQRGGLDVDARGAEHRAEHTEHTRAIRVVDHDVVALGAQVEAATVDVDDLLDLLQAGQRARDSGDGAVRGDRAH